MRSIQAGEMDERIKLYRRQEQQNEFGTLERTDKLLTECWAHARAMSGGERDRQNQTEAHANYVFVIYTDVVYGVDLREDDYIEWDGERYNVRFIHRRGKRELRTQIDAERGVAT